MWTKNQPLGGFLFPFIFFPSPTRQFTQLCWRYKWHCGLILWWDICCFQMASLLSLQQVSSWIQMSFFFSLGHKSFAKPKACDFPKEKGCGHNTTLCHFFFVEFLCYQRFRTVVFRLQAFFWSTTSGNKRECYVWFNSHKPHQLIPIKDSVSCRRMHSIMVKASRTHYWRQKFVHFKLCFISADIKYWFV